MTFYDILCHLMIFYEKLLHFYLTLKYTPGSSPFEWVPEQLSRFSTDPTIATLLEHPGQ